MGTNIQEEYFNEEIKRVVHAVGADGYALVDMKLSIYVDIKEGYTSVTYTIGERSGNLKYRRDDFAQQALHAFLEKWNVTSILYIVGGIYESGKTSVKYSVIDHLYSIYNKAFDSQNFEGYESSFLSLDELTTRNANIQKKLEAWLKPKTGGWKVMSV